MFRLEPQRKRTGSGKHRHPFGRNTPARYNSRNKKEFSKFQQALLSPIYDSTIQMISKACSKLDEHMLRKPSSGCLVNLKKVWQT